MVSEMGMMFSRMIGTLAVILVITQNSKMRHLLKRLSI